MKVLLTLHLLTAVFIAGPLVAALMSGLRALRTGDDAAARATARMTRVYGWASLSVPIFGLAMVRGKDAGWHIEFTELWIYLSVILYVLAAVAALAVTAPSFSAIAARFESGQPGGALRARAVLSAAAVTVLLVAIVVLMVYKPQ